MTPDKQVRLPASAVGVDVAALLHAGVAAQIDAGVVAEAAKRGAFRAANQGLRLEGGTITGKCVREAVARYLGGEPPRDAKWASKHLMFDAGHSNEDLWVASLALSWSGLIKREEEIPVEWEVAGIRGTGRPDIVLCDTDGKPKTGLELKLISSINTAADVIGPRGAPKLDHVCQAARYSACLGIPWQIWYTNRAVLPVPPWSWITPQLPKTPDEDETGAVDFSRASAKWPSKPTKVQPCVVGYHLTWHANRVYYMRVGHERIGMWTPTLVTRAALDSYWAACAEMLSARRLADRPATLEIDGSTGGFNKCDYCDWASMCDSVDDESGYDEWEAAVVARRLQVESDGAS